MSEASRFTPYSAEYLSLLARKGKLPSKKIGKVWFTTKSSLDDYMKRQMLKTSIQNGTLSGDKLNEIVNGNNNGDGDNGSQNNFQFKLNYISQKLSHGLDFFLETADSEKKPDSQDILVQELKKLSESFDGLSSKIENIASAKKEESFFTESISSIKSSNVSVENFKDKFNKFLDSSLGEHFGFLNKVGSLFKRSFKSVVSRPAAFLLYFFILLLVATNPAGRFIFGFFDDAADYAFGKIKNARTVMDFRPGTHENELLLLDKQGNISIFGHIETEGQFRSFVKEGIAPIMVDSKTMVENLNADYLDNLHAKDFTLAYVTKNGNVTFEDVYLEGGVEVGRTLLVKGATKLLSSLEVDGELNVFGNANFKKTITVEGPAYFNALLNAKDIAASGLVTGKIISGQLINGPVIVAGQSLASDGNFNVKGQSIFGGFAFFNSGLQAKSGDFEIALGTAGDFSARGNATLGYANKDVEITSQNWYITKEGGTSFTSIGITGATVNNIGNLSVTNFTASNASTTQLSVSDYFWSNGRTYLGDDVSDILNINAGNWILASGAATTTVAMTGGLSFDSGTFVIDPNSNRVGLGTATPETLLHIGSSSPSLIVASNRYKSAYIGGDLEISGTLYGSAVFTNSSTTQFTVSDYLWIGDENANN